ncbi:alpha/beta fold hydrolase [Streptomyces sp. NBC_01565]|uniref:alpha/beta fold hydrolase n=1 Tax=Streptomyces sp. NBC_01565 TaxID=2975881 RepID=UPI00224E2854|nr:alpha/beta hydrolase [Streptomyces sp. NBC_01565]MCX4546378.1 alpha/beta hydrolase [Streptomyces sp. NBC_01565]
MTAPAPAPPLSGADAHDHHIAWPPAAFACRVLTPRTPSTSEPLLVLGGGLQSRHSWARLERHLGPHHRLLIPDLPPARSPGQARSNLTWDDLTHAALTVADQLRIDRFAILAVSSGYPIGYRLAQQNSNRVTRLMLFGAAPRPSPRLAALIREGLRREATTAPPASASSRRRTAAQLVDVLTNTTAAAEHLLIKAAARVMLDQLNASPVDPLVRYVFDRGSLLLSDPLPTGGLAGIPTLVGVGEHDTTTTVEDNRAVAATIAGCTLLVMKYADHLLHLERDGDFAAAINLFLNDKPLHTLPHSTSEILR